MKSQLRSKRSASGSRYKDARKKKQFELGSEATLTKIGKIAKRSVRTIGANVKTRLLNAEIANVYDPKAKKYSKVKITTVIENPANRNFVRRSILTKGTIVETEAGKARVTSRPGQGGTVNAVLI